MALLDLESELARASDRRPFANGYEGDCWMSLWCTYDCAVDEQTCPLIGVAMLGKTPAAWIEREPGGLNRYTCTEHQEIVYEELATEGPS